MRKGAFKEQVLPIRQSRPTEDTQKVTCNSPISQTLFGR